MSIEVEEKITAWLEEVVLGLQLCPFALKPIRDLRHRVYVSDAVNAEQALNDLAQECQRLDNTAVEQLETTLLVLPHMLQDFYEFNDFLSVANVLLKSSGWEGVYQLASFHPRYQFAGTQPSDAENLTNTAPYAVVHLLREQSVEAGINAYEDVDDIPERNIARMKTLSKEQRLRLFPYLK